MGLILKHPKQKTLSEWYYGFVLLPIMIDWRSTFEEANIVFDGNIRSDFQKNFLLFSGTKALRERVCVLSNSIALRGQSKNSFVIFGPPAGLGQILGV